MTKQLPEDSMTAACISAFEFGGVKTTHEEALKASEEMVQCFAENNKEKVEDYTYIIAEIKNNESSYMMTFVQTPLGGGHILVRWYSKDEDQWYLPNIITAVASSGYNVDDVQIVPIAQHPDSTYSFEKAVKFLKKEKLLYEEPGKEDKGAYVTTTPETKLIKVFPTKLELHSYCEQIAPVEVLCSRHPSIKKANSFAKKLQKGTPWFKLELA